MTDIDRLIGFMAIMQVPFMNDPDALAYIEEVKTVLKQAKTQEPRVMTLDELKEYISLPPVFVDDLCEMEDYIQDIAPLYMDFPNPEPWDVHWRDVHRLRQNVKNAEQSYGKRWRVWTAKPTKEQIEAVKWDG